jgi:hypothetical protein
MKKISTAVALITVVLTGCGENGGDTSEYVNGLTVTGSKSEVELFGRQQAAKNPSFSRWSFLALDNGDYDATVLLPANTEGADIVLLAKDARTLGLSYRSEPNVQMRKFK